MSDDSSKIERVYCDNCRKRSNFFELFAPEGDLIMSKCLNCGTLINGNAQPSTRSKSLIAKRGVQMLGAAAFLAFIVIAYRRGVSARQESV